MTRPLALAALLLTTVAVPSLAKDEISILPNADSVFQKWGEASGWTIYADRSRNSCLIERTDEQGNVVQMGLTEIRSVGYVGVFTQADLDLKAGQDPVVVAFDDAVFTGLATTKTRNLPNGYKGGYVLTDDPNFVDLVQRKYEMVVFPNTESAIVINLDGSMKAIEAARKCTASLTG